MQNPLRALKLAQIAEESYRHLMGGDSDNEDHIFQNRGRRNNPLRQMSIKKRNQTIDIDEINNKNNIGINPLQPNSSNINIPNISSPLNNSGIQAAAILDRKKRQAYGIECI